VLKDEKENSLTAVSIKEEYMSKRREQTKKPATSEQTAGKEGNKKEGRGIFSRPALIVLSLAAVAFLIYSMISIIGIQSQIRDRKAELDELKEKITVQEIKNEEMQKLYDSTDSDFSALAEQIARDDLDYLKEGERVFVNVSGD